MIAGDHHYDKLVMLSFVICFCFSYSSSFRIPTLFDWSIMIVSQSLGYHTLPSASPFLCPTSLLKFTVQYCIYTVQHARTFPNLHNPTQIYATALYYLTIIFKNIRMIRAVGYKRNIFMIYRPPITHSFATQFGPAKSY